MLWALVSSAYVIYLYRKLKAEAAQSSPLAQAAVPTGISAEIDLLDQRLAAVEARLSRKGEERAR